MTLYIYLKVTIFWTSNVSETIRKPPLVEAQNLAGKQINTAKNGRHILMYGWDITTFGLGKQTSAILEFFCRLLPRPYRSNWRAIASGYQISSKSGHPRRNNDVIYNFDDGGGGGSILLPVLYCQRSKSIRKPNSVDVSWSTAEI